MYKVNVAHCLGGYTTFKECVMTYKCLQIGYKKLISQNITDILCSWNELKYFS